MNKVIIVFAFLQVLAVPILSRSVPSFLHVCKRNDPELNQCFINTFNEIRPYLKKGIPELDLPPGEPLQFLNASANTGKGRAVTLESKTWNQLATGLMDAEIKSLTLDLDNARCSGVLAFPYVRLQGEYKFKGKVMLFELDTVGIFDINSTDVIADVEWYGKFFEKKGKQHIEFEKVGLVLKLNKCQVYFTNLINGNEALTETVNQAINENIGSIVEELNPVIGETLGEIARQYFNRFFRLFSVDELFPKD